MRFNVSILFMFFSALAATVLPIGAAVYIGRKYKTSWRAVGVGALIFILFQPVLRFPLLKLIQGTSWFSYNSAVNPWLISIFLGFTAAIFESTGRLVAFKFLLKDKLEWKNGVAYGLGHGGIEAILLAGIPLINSIFISLSNPALVNQPPALYLVGGLERIFAMTLHIALSLIVLYGVKTKKNRYFFYAIFAHGVVDSSIGFIKNIAVIEAWVAVFAVVLLILIVRKIKQSSTEKILS
jgi:uncharacterized membrane protein YhfC